MSVLKMSTPKFRQKYGIDLSLQILRMYNFALTLPTTVRDPVFRWQRVTLSATSLLFYCLNAERTLRFELRGKFR